MYFEIKTFVLLLHKMKTHTKQIYLHGALTCDTRLNNESNDTVYRKLKCSVTGFSNCENEMKGRYEYAWTSDLPLSQGGLFPSCTCSWGNCPVVARSCWWRGTPSRWGGRGVGRAGAGAGRATRPARASAKCPTSRTTRALPTRTSICFTPKTDWFHDQTQNFYRPQLLVLQVIC